MGVHRKFYYPLGHDLSQFSKLKVVSLLALRQYFYQSLHSSGSVHILGNMENVGQ